MAAAIIATSLVAAVPVHRDASLAMRSEDGLVARTFSSSNAPKKTKAEQQRDKRIAAADKRIAQAAAYYEKQKRKAAEAREKTIADQIKQNQKAEAKEVKKKGPPPPWSDSPPMYHHPVDQNTAADGANPPSYDASQSH